MRFSGWICMFMAVLIMAVSPSVEAAPRKKGEPTKKTSQRRAESAVVFKITLDKLEYAKGSPVTARISLENQGREEVWVNKRFYVASQSTLIKDIYFKVIGPTGNELECKYNYETGLPKTDEFVTLAPKAVLAADNPRNLSHLFDLNEPGDYRASATYHNVFGSEIGVDALEEKLTSNEVTFKVTP